MNGYTTFAILLVAVYWVGFFIGQFFLKRHIANNIAEDPDRVINAIKQIKDIQDEMDDLNEPTEVLIEQHKDSFFVYNKQTSLFLGQGNSVDDAMKVVTERFPHTMFVYDTN